MAIQIDPDGNEVTALESLIDWANTRVLEIGCGDGRLTVRLAEFGAHVTGVDPDRASIRSARETLPERLADRIKYEVGSAGSFKKRRRSFDTVVFSWSL